MIPDITIDQLTNPPVPLLLKGIVCAYPNNENIAKYESYSRACLRDAYFCINTYPIHLTEMTVMESQQGKTFSTTRAEFNEYNSALCWINKISELIVYTDLGIDHFCQTAIELAKKHSVQISYCSLQ